MITLETQEKLFVICIMTTHGELWWPICGSPRRERVKIIYFLSKYSYL